MPPGLIFSHNLVHQQLRVAERRMAVKGKSLVTESIVVAYEFEGGTPQQQVVPPIPTGGESSSTFTAAEYNPEFPEMQIGSLPPPIPTGTLDTGATEQMLGGTPSTSLAFKRTATKNRDELT